MKITLELEQGTSEFKVPSDTKSESLVRMIEAERQVILNRDANNKVLAEIQKADSGRRWDVQNPEPIRYTGSQQTRLPVAGLEWYSGFGHGTFYAPDGRILNVHSGQAERFADYFGVRKSYEDSFRFYRATALGD